MSLPRLPWGPPPPPPRPRRAKQYTFTPEDNRWLHAMKIGDAPPLPIEDNPRLIAKLRSDLIESEEEIAALKRERDLYQRLYNDMLNVWAGMQEPLLVRAWRRIRGWRAGRQA